MRKFSWLICCSYILFLMIGCSYNEGAIAKEIAAPESLGSQYKSNEISLTDNLSFDSMLFPVYFDNKFEYIDSNGKIMTSMCFEKAKFFSNGRAVVAKGNKYGAIDLNGNLCIDFKFDELGNFNSNCAVVKNSNGLYGYINKEGNIIIEFKYTYARDFSNGIAYVSEKNYSNGLYINTNDECVLDIRRAYDPGDYSDDYIRITNMYYNPQTKETIECLYQDAEADYQSPCSYDFSNGFAVYPTSADMSQYKFMYIDKLGKNAFNKVFDYAESFNENLAVVEKNGIRGVIDSSGEFVYYNNAVYGQYSEGYITYCEKNDDMVKWGFLDSDGNISIDAQYDYVLRDFADGLALVKIGKMLMYVDYSGEIIYEFEEPEYKFWRY